MGVRMTGGNVAVMGDMVSSTPWVSTKLRPHSAEEIRATHMVLLGP